MVKTALEEFAFLIPLLPALAFAITFFFGKKVPSGGAIVPILAIAASFVISFAITLGLLANPGEVVSQSYSWFAVLDIGILIDPLAAVMLSMVSFVSLLIHIYAVSYMSHDEGKARYFAETALFTAAMLSLVLSDNILQLFVSWELVGLCSYLLIGFWFEKPSAAAAAKKAFLTTRVGDVMFLTGIIVLTSDLLKLAGGFQEGVYLLRFDEIFSYIPQLSALQVNIFGFEVSHLTIITLLFFGGAVGKSGQFPLHVWLPDAMEGPTTVSALIHAATMVTAGVYLVARTFPMFLAAPGTLMVVAYLGGFTALFAGTMGIVMNDLKRVLAYSTISQLGYMMLALGLGATVGLEAVGVSLFHLINHAFFKALLFLCAGSVIHAVGTQDMRELGGVGKVMPITAGTMAIAALSLAGFGIPGTSIGTSGFMSKDPIIENAYLFAEHSGNWIPYIFAIVAALLTSIYIFRLIFMTFTGKPRSDYHGHESPAIMTVPLSILALFALVFGSLTRTGFMNFLEETFTNSFVDLNIGNLAGIGGNELVEAVGHEPVLILWLPLIMAVAGLAIAFVIYYLKAFSLGPLASMKNPIYRLLYRRYYQHEIYTEFFSIGIVYGVIAFLTQVVDVIVDSIVEGIGILTVGVGEELRKVQTGVVQTYATVIIAGVSLLIILIKLITEVL
ncbi:NADH:ubiquinone oxidoreductase subunit L [Methanosarcina siciliae HI350]|uniref:NADH:ubiquinone oxidoreductase subunit L n=1 Tax=Methanosarcina siciliae HI350 TaxID=1434119 RepID=A0A0E3PCL1_9EURY|nr:F420H2 dehydrogenase subunit FpoL [Methanosarcina siciliae]AKB32202.1 NADH:ubiquinone oxidoreductase subunit L [Methanosarcina siciliae HI350]